MQQVRKPPEATPLHNQYADEAARVAQRYHNQVAEIERLNRELIEWERRALSAEGECRRHEERLANMEAKLDKTKDELTAERDSYKHRLTSLVSQFHTAGSIILKCLDAAESEAPKQVDMALLTKEIEQTVADAKAQTLPEFLSKPTE